MTIIVYSSHTGSTEKYALEFASRTALDCYPVGAGYPESEPIAFFGWLRKDVVVGIEKVDRSRLKAVCVVGLDNPGSFHPDIVASKNKYKVPTYYLRGWIDRKRLNIIDKSIVVLVCGMMKLKGLNERNLPLFNAMMEGGSFYDPSYLDPIERFLKR